MKKIAEIRELEQKLATKRITVESDDKGVRVTMDGHGTLVDLEIRNDVISRQNSARLEKDITLTVRRADLVVEKLRRRLAKSFLGADE
ncbi:YbaB/EbfC family nucleoid-associated protein [Actinoallomurus sp. NBC_01490]|jgi:DNA-binding protein YbaB|uniref:YbaB/EbfC family nucleoid-associated protein n=1 Tax=Actinoallomurus sp. NBC_01490 TaxID=2903557 RepID=UPI002E314181|nr:YbaB/EbfC family nucleoid-associated protein [Actinoallomurus sp. NBC_01490]